MKKSIFNVSRRSFLSQSSKATLAVGLGSSVIGSALITSCGGVKEDAKKIISTSFSQTPLVYDFNALEPHIDAKTMEIHYTKHAASYAGNLNEAAQEEDVNITLPLEDVMTNMSNYSTKMRNNGGGHYNHELFWAIMSPNGGGQPSGKLAEAINDEFGSFDEFKTKFEDEAKGRFGSGWGWLVLDNSRNLKVGSTPNQDNPMMDLADFKGVPLIGIDVWEHAYYLNYQNRRPDYVSAFWNLINWDIVNYRYEAIMEV